MMEDITKLDLYELIGAASTATVQEIKKAYRKTALSCHPDKHADNPKAAESFHRLTRALEVLTDVSSRAAYDKVRNAKIQAKLRTEELDLERKKLKKDLEAREAACRLSEETAAEERRLHTEIERLRKEGSRLVQEEVEYVQRMILEELRLQQQQQQQGGCGGDREIRRRVKIKWKVAKEDPDNGGYDRDSLYGMLYKYGDIADLVLSPIKKGRALVEFLDEKSAETAVQLELGLARNPLSLEGMWQCASGKKRKGTKRKAATVTTDT